jgi:hypothetical protein
VDPVPDPLLLRKSGSAATEAVMLKDTKKHNYYFSGVA